MIPDGQLFSTVLCITNHRCVETLQGKDLTVFVQQHVHTSFSMPYFENFQSASFSIIIYYYYCHYIIIVICGQKVCVCAVCVCVWYMCMYVYVCWQMCSYHSVPVEVSKQIQMLFLPWFVLCFVWDRVFYCLLLFHIQQVSWPLCSYNFLCFCLPSQHRCPCITSMCCTTSNLTQALEI